MAEYLPPRETWPARIYTLPEFQSYAERFNPTEELLGKAVAAGRGESRGGSLRGPEALPTANCWLRPTSSAIRCASLG